MSGEIKILVSYLVVCNVSSVLAQNEHVTVSIVILVLLLNIGTYRYYGDCLKETGLCAQDGWGRGEGGGGVQNWMCCCFHSVSFVVHPVHTMFA